MNTKKMNKLELYWYIIGGTIGAGLFVLIPIAIGMTGKSAVFAVIVATIMSILVGFYSIIISAMFPLKGGDYSQVAFLSSNYIAGVYGVMWVICCVTIGGFATSAVSYIVYLLPGIRGYEKPVTLAIMLFFFILNYFGAKFGAKVEAALTIMLLLALGVFVVVGMPRIDHAAFFTSKDMFVGGFSGFSGAVAMLMWAMMGPALNAVGLAKEVENPTRTIPRSIIGGSIIIAVIYFFVVYVACGVLPYEDVAFQELTVVAKEIFPAGIYFFFVMFGAVFALLSTLMSSVVVYRYPCEQMAEEGWLPPIFKKKTKNGWPYVAMIALFIGGVIPVMFDISMDTIASYTEIPDALILLVVTWQCITLPKKYPEHWKKCILHMPMPLYYVVCGLSLLCNVYMIYCYCAELTFKAIAMTILTTVIIFVYVAFCLKTKKVDPNYLQEQKEAIVEEALSYHNEADAQ